MTNNLENNLSRFSIDQRLKNYRKGRKSEDYIMLAITIFSLIFFGTFIIRPSINLILELNQKSKEYKNLSSQLENKIQNLEQIKSEREKFKEELSLLEIAITKNPNESEILNNINYVASRNNIQLSDINFNFDSEKNQVNINFKATGTYENSIIMFEKLNNLLTPITIDSVNMIPQKDYGNNIVELNISAVSYYLNK